MSYFYSYLLNSANGRSEMRSVHLRYCPRRNWCWIEVVKYRGDIHSECFFELTCCWAKIYQQELYVYIRNEGWVDAYVWCGKRNERVLGCVRWRDGDTSPPAADLLE